MPSARPREEFQLVKTLVAAGLSSPASRTPRSLTAAASRCSTRSSVRRVEVRAEGLEPPRSFEHQDLNLACLPRFQHARVYDDPGNTREITVARDLRRF